MGDLPARRLQILPNPGAGGRCRKARRGRVSLNTTGAVFSWQYGKAAQRPVSLTERCCSGRPSDTERLNKQLIRAAETTWLTNSPKTYEGRHRFLPADGAYDGPVNQAATARQPGKFSVKPSPSPYAANDQRAVAFSAASSSVDQRRWRANGGRMKGGVCSIGRVPNPVKGTKHQSARWLPTATSTSASMASNKSGVSLGMKRRACSKLREENSPAAV